MSKSVKIFETVQFDNTSFWKATIVHLAKQLI